jgi:hypothetical protein
MNVWKWQSDNSRREVTIMSNNYCMFYNANGTLTRHSLSCGYVEVNGTKNMSMEHNVFHVKGTDGKGVRVWACFTKVGEARRFLKS